VVKKIWWFIKPFNIIPECERRTRENRIARLKLGEYLSLQFSCFCCTAYNDGLDTPWERERKDTCVEFFCRRRVFNCLCAAMARFSCRDKSMAVTIDARPLRCADAHNRCRVGSSGLSRNGCQRTPVIDRCTKGGGGGIVQCTLWLGTCQSV